MKNYKKIYIISLNIKNIFNPKYFCPSAPLQQYWLITTVQQCRPLINCSGSIFQNWHVHKGNARYAIIHNNIQNRRPV